jgi:hypothetical protein
MATLLTSRRELAKLYSPSTLDSSHPEGRSLDQTVPTKPRSAIFRWLAISAPWFGFVVLTMLSSTGMAFLMTGDTSLVVPYLQGERFLVSQTDHHLGTLRQGDERTFTVDLLNQAGESVQVYGAQRDCSCLVTDKFPVTIEPGQRLSLGVRVHVPDQPGAFEQHVTFYTTSPEKPRIFVTARADVVAQEGPNPSEMTP